MDRLPYTRTQLAQALRSVGVEAGQLLMLHSSVKAVGPVMGGPNTILQAVFDVLGASGTLMMYVGWEDIPDYVHELPEDVRQVYYDEYPPFDPLTARAVRENSVLAEFLRTWPGAARSLNPEKSMAAVGAQAAFLTDDHPLDYGYGDGTPLARLAENGGSVLMLGAPLDNITLLHYAEYRAKLRHKTVIRYECPILRDGKRVWVEMEDYETGEPHDDYSFDEIARAYLARGRGRSGPAGDATAFLFDAADLVDFGVQWLEARFG